MEAVEHTCVLNLLELSSLCKIREGGMRLDAGWGGVEGSGRSTSAVSMHKHDISLDLLVVVSNNLALNNLDFSANCSIWEMLGEKRVRTKKAIS